MLGLSVGLISCGGAQTLEYTLTICTTEGGEVTAPGEGTFTYEEGTNVTLLAFPHAGYHFVNWTGDVGTVADVNDAGTAITMDSDYSITANFEAIPPAQYSLTISDMEGGSVTAPGEGTYTYNAGTVVNLVATPDAGYRFGNWTGAVATIRNVNAASTSVTMNGNCSITANFVRLYNLTITSAGPGSVTTPGQGTFTYDAGTVVDLVATPTIGHWFVGWTGDVAALSCGCQSTTITTNADYSVMANFS